MTETVPKVLITFLEHVIAGEREVNDFRSLDVRQDVVSIINNVPSDKQENYKPNSANSTFYHKDAILQQIGIGLSVYQATRNKYVIDLLSSVKTSKPYLQVGKMKASDNKYIPLNFIMEMILSKEHCHTIIL